VEQHSFSQVSTSHEKNGYRAAEGGFFLKTYRGGGKVSQIYASRKGRSAVLSDTLLQHGKAVLTLLVLDPRDNTETEGIRNILEEHEMRPTILSNDSIQLLCKRL
jgi:diphthamide biosynthesis methyltransferase